MPSTRWYTSIAAWLLIIAAAVPGWSAAQPSGANYPVLSLLNGQLTIPGVLIAGTNWGYDVDLVVTRVEPFQMTLRALRNPSVPNATAAYDDRYGALYMPVVGIWDGRTMLGVRGITLYVTSTDPMVFSLDPPQGTSSDNGCGNMSYDDCMFYNYRVITPSVPWNL